MTLRCTLLFVCLGTAAVAAPVSANLHGFSDPPKVAAKPRSEATFGGGEKVAEKPPVLLQGATAVADGDVVILNLLGPQSRVEATPEALGLPGDWKRFENLQLTFVSEAEADVELTVVLPRGRLARALHASPAGHAVLTVPLDDMPLAASLQPPYHAMALRVTATTAGPTRLRLESLLLLTRGSAPPPVADRFGQRRNATWPGKVHEERELRERASAETSTLAETPRRTDLDEFGGWLNGPTFEGTGYFRVAHDPAGRWWFITPNGHPFWSIGTTGVRVGAINDTARVTGNESFYEELPAPGSPAWFHGRQWTPLGDVDVDANVGFYRSNVLKKYGNVEAWRDRVLSRWPSWGLNTIGAWSDEIVLRQHRVPHTRFLRARAAVPGVPLVNGFPDIWDERWAAWVDAEFELQTRDVKTDAWLVGYFVDNEAHWADMRLLDIAADARLRDAWLQHVRGCYERLDRFNADCGTQCKDWAEVRALTSATLPSRGPGRELVAAFEALYAERYFATVASLLKRHDPNHLYLGSRFVRVPPAPAIVAAAGRHVDVLSVNCYARVPDATAFRQWHELSGGRPILIGEFDFPLQSPRQLPPPWEAFAPQRREEMLVDFIATWAKQPWSLGCHWYQHADQPLLGRYSDGENQTVGFVDVTDTPYPELVRGAQRASAAVYRQHAAATNRR